MNRILAPLLAAFAVSASLIPSYPVISQQGTSAPASPQSSPSSSPQGNPSPSPQTPQPSPASTAKPSIINSVKYKCDGGKRFSADYLSNNSVQATFGSKVLILPQVVSGSGIRYSNGSVTLSAKGDQALVEVGKKALFKNCIAQ